MRCLSFWLTALVLIGLSKALDDEETSIENEIIPETDNDHDSGNALVEGRACYDCHGGGGGSSNEHLEIPYPNHHKDILHWIIDGVGFKGIFLIIIPIIGLEIAIVIILAIILKYVKKISESLAYQEEPTYAYTYQTYDTPYPASYGSYGSHGATSYGGGGGGGAGKPATGGYTKRTTRGAPNFSSRSTLEYATNLFEKAFEKYIDIDEEQE
ncbi:hypothetical protein SK128_013247 [Halocaridina rubra]|uniref:Cytochrome c domain-containing protein n=1 Tax=Halocaridina rubra TaxID=373956 RepID=A0AAN8XCK4_HALRR